MPARIASTVTTMKTKRTSMRITSVHSVRLWALLLALCGLLLGMAASASAKFQFETVQAGPLGPQATLAGGHPDVQTVFFTSADPNGGPLPIPYPLETPRTVVADLPAGFAGNPKSMPTCTRTQLAAAQCPTNSQVGVVQLVTDPDDPFGTSAKYGVFLLEPDDGHTAEFGFSIAGISNVLAVASVRSSGDYGLHVTVSDLPAEQLPNVFGSALTLWGVPADPSHNTDRLVPGDTFATGNNNPADMAPVAFLTNPTRCDGQPLTTTISVDSWQNPGAFATASVDAPPVTGCDQLPFDPTMSVRPDVTTPDAPAGLGVHLSFPQDGLLDPGKVATAHLKTATVTLPDGMTINPASANGLEACTDPELQLGSTEPVTCPDASKIGSVTATTPLLAEQLSGGIYLRSQNSSDPESGEMFRIALVLENKLRGLSARLPGSVRADRNTGRLTATFDNNPQLPVSDIDLQFKSGPRAALATPPTCGQKTVDAELVSWSGKTVSRQSTFSIDCLAGLGGFAPVLTAGTLQPVGGAFSPFALNITKPDGNVALSGLSLSLPAGLVASLKGNLGTQVGTVKAYGGPGSSPFVLPGQVLLEGAYGDAPFSLKVVVPAKAGPFDLGEVVVRQKIYVDPIDAHVTVVSDPIPTIVKGVPVRLQRLDVNVDKPGFVINPTSCAAKAIEGVLRSAAGQTAALSVRFQVGDCAALGLKPSLSLGLSGKGQTVDGKHPAVTATLTQEPGQANLKKVRVALPLSLALDPDNANGLCEFVDGSKPVPTCPKASIVGSATAVTPILDEPLSGPVYFVKNIRKDPKSGREIRTLPKLVIPLVGQNGVRITLTGTSDVVDDQLVTTFDNVPDAPVSSFKLSIVGGKGGILVVSGTDICKATQIADQQIDGQNNKNADADVYIQTPSCGLKVISKKVGKTSVAIKVGGLGAGKVTVSGRGVKKTSKTITKSTVATITAKRTKGTPGKVTVSFDPTGPAKARKATK